MTNIYTDEAFSNTIKFDLAFLQGVKYFFSRITDTFLFEFFEFRTVSKTVVWLKFIYVNNYFRLVSSFRYRYKRTRWISK